MKTKSIFPGALFFLFWLNAAGQAPDFSALCREHMTKLAYLAGQWEGEATLLGPGARKDLIQREDVGFRLDSTVLVIEGTGIDKPGGDVVFSALAVINFNVTTRAYGLRSFLHDGRSTDAYFRIMEHNTFEWGFDVPGNAGRVRYIIVLDPAARSWSETGEFTADGTTWTKFLEMQLHKKG